MILQLQEYEQIQRNQQLEVENYSKKLHSLIQQLNKRLEVIKKVT